MIQKSKDTLSDERELLLIEKKALEDQLHKLKDHAAVDKDYAADLYAQKTNNFADRFRKQTQQNENDLKVIKSQYEAIQEKYMVELKELAEDIRFCRDKVKIIDQRRTTETQAFSADIQSIKKRVINFERYIKRLKRYVDDEQTAELIAELENTEVAQVDMDQLISDIKRVEDEVKTAKKFKATKAKI